MNSRSSPPEGPSACARSTRSRRPRRPTRAARRTGSCRRRWRRSRRSGMCGSWPAPKTRPRPRLLPARCAIAASSCPPSPATLLTDGDRQPRRHRVNRERTRINPVFPQTDVERPAPGSNAVRSMVDTRSTTARGVRRCSNHSSRDVVRRVSNSRDLRMCAQRCPPAVPRAQRASWARRPCGVPRSSVSIRRPRPRPRTDGSIAHSHSSKPPSAKSLKSPKPVGAACRIGEKHPTADARRDGPPGPDRVAASRRARARRRACETAGRTWVRESRAPGSQLPSVAPARISGLMVSRCKGTAGSSIASRNR